MKFYENHTKFWRRLISVLVPSSKMRDRLNRALQASGWADFIDRLRGDAKRFRIDARMRNCCPFELSVCAIMKNEGPYLREWIEYHRLVGVQKFYLYDNESNDDTRKILEPYIKSGIVDYTYFPGDKQQQPAYNDCIKRHKFDTKWLAFIDLDEFIVVKTHDTISEFLATMSDNVSQVVFNWAVFGSNGHITKPKGLVIENYTMRANNSWEFKSIVNPRLVQNMKCHVHEMLGETVYVPWSDAQVNHYYCKSWDEYLRRLNRGDAWYGFDFGKQNYNREKFDAHDRNDVSDEYILKYAPAIRRMIKK